MTGNAHLVALLALRDLGPFRLRSLLDAFGEPERAWEAVVQGRVGDTPLRVSADKRPDLLAGWRSTAAETDVTAILPAHRAAGVQVLDPTHPDWPEAFIADPEPPPVLFVRGDPALLSSTSVAIVGTRRCTAAGTATARELGEDLSAAGVGVVSGLALGIDGAAHHGALRGGGPVIGVVATGLDVVYPRRHRDLWADVAVGGVLASEAPLGTKAERWRFPARNRLIAALSRFVVVVESKRTGGSMLTVDSAVERGVEVGAVPGPVRAPMSAGPNQLLAEGCTVVRDATDVVVALGLSTAPLEPPDDPASRGGGGWATDDPVDRALGWTPTSLDDLVVASGRSFADVAARLTELELAGAVQRQADGYQWRAS